MTQKEEQSLVEKVDKIYETVIRNDEKLKRIDGRLEDGAGKFIDMETRIRAVEALKNKIIAWVTIIGSAAGIVTGIIMSLLKN